MIIVCTLHSNAECKYNSISGNYVLNYLYSEAKHPSFVEEELSLLYSRITKLSWFDSNKDEWFFRNVLEDISKFLQVLVHRD